MTTSSDLHPLTFWCDLISDLRKAALCSSLGHRCLSYHTISKCSLIMNFILFDCLCGEVSVGVINFFCFIYTVFKLTGKKPAFLESSSEGFRFRLPMFHQSRWYHANGVNSATGEISATQISREYNLVSAKNLSFNKYQYLKPFAHDITNIVH